MGSTQRYFMLVSYLGPGFWGSQIQNLKGGSKTVETVQYVLENGLKYIYRLEGERPIRIFLASRTDKGVHSLKAALHVDLPPFLNSFLKPEIIKCKLNSYFARLRNVRVLEVHNVPDSFHVSTAILDKTYLFRLGILRKEYYKASEKNLIPITEAERTHFLYQNLEFDMRKAEEAAQLFEGKKDFAAIMGNPAINTRPTICNIMTFTLQEAQPLVSFDPLNEKFSYYHFICKGDRFLFHMVRRMVSLSISVGFNILSLKDIQKLFDKPVPSSWPRRGYTSVYGYGLYLVDVNIDPKKISGSKYLEQKTGTGKMEVRKLPETCAGFVVDEKLDLQIAKIFEFLYLGSQDVAQDYEILKKNRITHVLSIGVNLETDAFCNIKFKTVELLDEPNANISKVLDSCIEFIENSRLENDDNKVFVHCNAGYSRAPTVIIAYLMTKHGYSLEESFRMVKEKRNIKPNDGFMKQLQNLRKNV